jgi:GYF domain 2
MIHGKQAGPVTRAELVLQASAGHVGPRTYLWKEGMESWIRAKDVPELVPLFAVAPAPPPPPPSEEPPAAQGPGTAEGRVGLPIETAAASDDRPAAGEGASPDAPTPPRGTRVLEEARPAAAEQPHMDGTAGRDFRIGQPERRGPLRAILAVLALALASGLLAFALLSQRKGRVPEPAPPVGAQTGSAPAAPSAGGEAKVEERPAGNAPGDSSAAAPALSPDELKRKVDESQPVLQGCVDEALKRDPSLRVGKILLSTTIAPSGAVTSARIDQKAVDQSPLGACLKSAARRMQFPPFSGEAFAMDIPIVVTGAP